MFSSQSISSKDIGACKCLRFQASMQFDSRRFRELLSLLLPLFVPQHNESSYILNFSIKNVQNKSKQDRKLTPHQTSPWHSQVLNKNISRAIDPLGATSYTNLYVITPSLRGSSETLCLSQ